jgi:hypothetical protein
MKKLLALLLVLGMTSLAGASMIKLTDEGLIINANIGDTVTLTIETDTGLYALDVIASVAGGDLIVGAISTLDAATYGWDATLSFDPLPLPPVASTEMGLGNFMGNMNTIVAYVDVGYTGGTQVVSIAGGTARGGSGDITMAVPAFSTGVVTIVPEPMTIALLGLGGLALLRRRK